MDAKAGEVVKIRGQGIAGSRITIALAGDARLLGQTPVPQDTIGMDVVEFSVQVGAPGRITATVTAEPPMGGGVTTTAKTTIIVR